MRTTLPNKPAVVTVRARTGTFTPRPSYCHCGGENLTVLFLPHLLFQLMAAQAHADIAAGAGQIVYLLTACESCADEKLVGKGKYQVIGCRTQLCELAVVRELPADMRQWDTQLPALSTYFTAVLSKLYAVLAADQASTRGVKEFQQVYSQLENKALSSLPHLYRGRICLKKPSRSRGARARRKRALLLAQGQQPNN